jgi:hypothetical protein
MGQKNQKMCEEANRLHTLFQPRFAFRRPADPRFQWRPPAYSGPRERPPGVAFHYTTCVALAQIYATGALRPHPEYPGQPRPVLWCTLDHIFDVGALKLSPEEPHALMDFEEMQRRFGLARVVLPAAAVPLHMGEIMRYDLFYMVTWGLLFRVPRGAWSTFPWRGSYDPIPQERWLAVEVWSDRDCAWVPCEEE